jgi:hypothetical protein
MALGLACVHCQKQSRRPHAHFRLEASPASAFRTSACEIPNCRAIRDGVTPALKAARTAFDFPLVSGSGASSTRRFRGLSSKAGGFLPRRCCSAEATATNWSSSGSVSRLIAFGRSLGRTCRMAGVVSEGRGGFIGGEERSPTVENRSGVVGPMRSLPMVLILPPLSQGGKRLLFLDLARSTESPSSARGPFASVSTLPLSKLTSCTLPIACSPIGHCSDIGVAKQDSVAAL